MSLEKILLTKKKKKKKKIVSDARPWIPPDKDWRRHLTHVSHLDFCCFSLSAAAAAGREKKKEKEKLPS